LILFLDSIIDGGGAWIGPIFEDWPIFEGFILEFNIVLTIIVETLYYRAFLKVKEALLRSLGLKTADYEAIWFSSSDLPADDR
jgi:hypothetical protein